MRKLVLAFVMFSATGNAEVAGPAARLQEVQFPDRKPVSLVLAPIRGAPDVRLDARVTFRDGQSRVDVTYGDLEPALLYGGDVTCWVLWAASRDGVADNLGELGWAPKRKQSFATPRSAFALMVTAESHCLVERPSGLIALVNRAADPKQASSTRFTFDLGPLPDHALRTIADLHWDPAVPAELAQARRVRELAKRYDADVHAAGLYSEAGAALDLASSVAEAGGGKPMRDAARRSTALSNEAIPIALAAREAIRLQEERDDWRQKLDESERRAQQAEDLAGEREAQVAQRLQEVTLLQDQRDTLREELAELRGSKSLLEDERVGLKHDLRGALSQVAKTADTARGFVVSLPDILFGSDEASLKSEAQVVLAKLAGILLIMKDLRVRVEGHTDASGHPERNQTLSQERADTVRGFLISQGIAKKRVEAMGLGSERPVADNSTPKGRRRNRRVEIILSER